MKNMLFINMRGLNGRKNKKYKEIIAILGIATIILCGAIGTGIINYNGDLSSGILGLTSKVDTLDKTLVDNDGSKFKSQDEMNVAKAASKKFVGSKKAKVYHTNGVDMLNN
ncbi:hypothetical protein ALNOE001_07510 [Candidatus Methanobinarius endosymbioticus]|uniref:Uncharacterized protein n=1 Tax=Candidatus Methanobinarius endosymbioticus TaxID=2006182 RepID=A0A366MBT0_9EURY|nr:hypothetical protein ALNOE001_07510 [Candidatus Methanobinarius endosymbioticus]